MWNGDVTKVLEGFLVTRGDIKRPVGAGSLTNEKAGGSYRSADPQVLTDARGGELAPAYELREGAGRSPILIWNNPNMTSAAVRRTSRAALAIVGVK